MQFLFLAAVPWESHLKASSFTQKCFVFSLSVMTDGHSFSNGSLGFDVWLDGKLEHSLVGFLVTGQLWSSALTDLSAWLSMWII